MEANRRRRGGGGGGGFFLPEEDIIFDVLTRLTAKMLCRLRCVCKGWRSLIAAQKSRAGPLIAGVFGSQRTGHQKLELRVMDLDGSIRVFEDIPRFLVSTRLDLICVCNMQGAAAMIIDPSAGRVLVVGEPNPRIGKQASHIWHYSLGRAAPSGAYKVLRVQKSSSYDYDYLCEIATIYDCGSEPAWRQRPMPPVVTHWCSGEKATVNGILYFMSYPQHTFQVASFNLESEDWTETIDGPTMGLENEKNGVTWNIALAELKGALNMVETVCYRLTNQEGYGRYINIWLLTDSKTSSWVKQYTIRMSETYVRTVKALDVLSDGRILLLKGKPEQNGTSYRYILQFYNPSTEAHTDFMELPVQ